MAATRYRCVDCKRVANGSPSVRWCDNCGGELKPLYPQRRRKAKPRA